MVVIGLGGIILPILPGLFLQLFAVVFWAFEESTAVAWAVAGLSLLVTVAVTFLKYTRPGRKLKDAGIPMWVLVVAVGLGILGFFVIPVVGGPLAFVLAVYVFERVRSGRERAWPSTKVALVALAQSVGIELAGGVTILLLLLAGVFLT